jgi:hypothetical protein
MVTAKQGKNKDLYVCNKCYFNCSYLSEFKRHIMTAKHKMIIDGNKKQVENKDVYSCQCGKKYKHASGMSRHKSYCNIKDTSNTSVNIIETNNINDFVIDLISQNKELMNILIVQNQENKDMHNTIKSLIPKIGNNNTTNNNNQFNLQVFLNEDCKDALNFSEFIEQIQVSFEDLENQAENGYIKGISRLFIESLQELGQNKRPIHCSDKKRKTIYIKEDNEWDKEGSLEVLKNGINEVTKRTLQTLKKEKENNAEEYKDGDSEFSMKCLEIQRNLFPSAPREATIGKVIEKITQSSGIL